MKLFAIFISHRHHFGSIRLVTLKLYGKLFPPWRSHVTGAEDTEDDVQSTTIESPGRKYDFDGSNFKYGNLCSAKILQDGKSLETNETQEDLYIKW